jgi:AcrR family transcriptional regulator
MSGENKRTYRKRKRAESEQATRARITEATVELHGTIGPARTSIKAIAERAGVQRATVYSHFPDPQALFDACTAHFYERHPKPDPGRWTPDIPPYERLCAALAQLYAWFAETEQMLTLGLRDRDFVPAGTRESFAAYFERVRDVLLAGRAERGRALVRVSGAISHGTDFFTWRSLVHEGHLTHGEAIALVSAMVEAASRPPAQSRASRADETSSLNPSGSRKNVA